MQDFVLRRSDPDELLLPLMSLMYDLSPRHQAHLTYMTQVRSDARAWHAIVPW
jgi:hypothetical protein